MHIDGETVAATIGFATLIYVALRLIYDILFKEE